MNNIDLAWEINEQKGLVSGLELKGNQLISPWSIEFGDPASFFSLEQSGWRTNRSNVSVSSAPEQEINGAMDVQVSTGSAKLSWQDDINKAGNKISRQATLEALTPNSLLLMDFVIQYRFKADIFDTVIIDEMEYKHQDKNLYIQKPVQVITIISNKLGLGVKVSTVDSAHTEKFQQEMYARDRGDAWIVHSRLMPTSADLETIKLNVKWYNRALPTWLAQSLLKIPGMKNYLWYRGEIKGYPRWNPILRFFKPSAYIFSKLSAGDQLYLNTEAEFYELI